MHSDNNLLKKILMIGITAIVSGLILISPLMTQPTVDYNAVNNLLIWVIILLLSVIAAATEDVTSELKTMARNQIDEIRLLKAELIIMRQEMKVRRK